MHRNYMDQAPFLTLILYWRYFSEFWFFCLKKLKNSLSFISIFFCFISSFLISFVSSVYFLIYLFISNSLQLFFLTFNQVSATTKLFTWIVKLYWSFCKICDRNLWLFCLAWISFPNPHKMSKHSIFLLVIDFLPHNKSVFPLHRTSMLTSIYGLTPKQSLGAELWATWRRVIKSKGITEILNIIGFWRLMFFNCRESLHLK